MGRNALSTILYKLEEHGMAALGEHGDIKLVVSKRILEHSL